MYVITNEAKDSYPAIRAVGSDEEVACAVYATLQNAALCSRVHEGVVTNSFEGYYCETLLCTNWNGFAELRDHMLEVHEVELRLTRI